MTEASIFRLTLMRATHLPVFTGQAVTIWPGLTLHTLLGNSSPGATPSLSAVVSMLAVLGIRYPLQLRPLLLLEPVWKTI
ncbi:MAG: hypothetical protein ABI583_13250 [Betaproteobacteria bacterium]